MALFTRQPQSGEVAGTNVKNGHPAVPLPVSQKVSFGTRREPAEIVGLPVPEVCPTSPASKRLPPPGLSTMKYGYARVYTGDHPPRGLGRSGFHAPATGPAHIP